jgi:excisionase family DNA binding protein
MAENLTEELFNREAFLTKIDVAKLLRITTRSVDEWMRKRRLPFYKIGRTVRFKLADVEQHLRNTCLVAGRAGSSL